MTGLELLFFSAVLAAKPSTPIPWFSEHDYPIQAFERGWEGATVFELTIDPNGQPVGCAVEVSSGHGTLDKRACSIAMKRAKFAPALDAKGVPAYGVYRSRLNWAVDPELWAQSEVGPDFEVSLNKLPAGATGPVSVQYAVLVDTTGKPLDCRAITSGHADILNVLGCAKIKQDYRRAVALQSGTPVTAVRTAWITFTQ
ncbi:MAG: energy transducer TonB [Sphingomicrobium sp.]